MCTAFEFQERTASVRQVIVMLVVLMIACGGVAGIGYHQSRNAAEYDRPLFHKVYRVASFLLCMAATALLLTVVQHFMNTD